MKYAGFIKRTAAFVVDYLLIVVCSIVIGGIISRLINYPYVNFKGFEIPFFRFIYYFVFTILTLIYYLIAEGKYQATFGKRCFGLKVTNQAGNNISFISNLSRFLFVMIFAVSIHISHIFFSMGAKPINYNYLLIDRVNIISYIIAFLCIISYLCLLFSSKKQTLYDKLTKTFVIEDKEKSGVIASCLLVSGALICIFYLCKFVFLFWWDKFIG